MCVNGRDSRGENSSYVSQWTKDDPTRMYLEPDEDRVVACLEARIANISGYSIHHQEAIQVQLSMSKLNDRSCEIVESEDWSIRKTIYGQSGSHLIPQPRKGLLEC